ncbi:MAG: chlorite dismutase family protein [Chloroflexota bacterium]
MATVMQPQPAAAPAGKKAQQFVRFAFYKAAPSWRELSSRERAAARDDLLRVVGEAAEKMILRSYSTVATRADCDFLLWQVSYEMDDLHRLAAQVNASAMGRHLSMPHSYLGMTKRSTYVDHHVHADQEGQRMVVRPTDRRYFFVYPFVKTRPWYLLTPEQRQALMDTHIRVGHKYPSVKLNTTYSFGLDDQEFVVAFETDAPQDFLDLVMELREAESSIYTLRDTPTFTCLQMPLREALEALG